MDSYVPRESLRQPNLFRNSTSNVSGGWNDSRRHPDVTGCIDITSAEASVELGRLSSVPKYKQQTST
jgi:hypothetical protein